MLSDWLSLRKKEALVEAKEEIHKLRSEADKENRDRRNELTTFRTTYSSERRTSRR